MTTGHEGGAKLAGVAHAVGPTRVPHQLRTRVVQVLEIDAGLAFYAEVLGHQSPLA